MGGFRFPAGKVGRRNWYSMGFEIPCEKSGPEEYWYSMGVQITYGKSGPEELGIRWGSDSLRETAIVARDVSRGIIPG